MHRSHPAPASRTEHPAGDVASLLRHVVSALGAGGEGAGRDFLARRVAAELHGRLPDGDRAALNHLHCLLAEDAVDVHGLADTLLLLAGAAEKNGRLDTAATALRDARGLVDGRPELALHEARIARKNGDRERALTLYRSLRTRPDAPAPLARMAEVGEAMLADDPRRALGRVVRDAVRAGEAEAAAVGLEERARIRRRSGDRAGALRDYLVACARFDEPVDRARLLHEAADMLSLAGDALAARELLLVAARTGRPEQRRHAASRLYALARSLGDDLGRRRWRAAGSGTLVSLAPGRAPVADAGAAARTRRALRRLGLLSVEHGPGA